MAENGLENRYGALFVTDEYLDGIDSDIDKKKGKATSKIWLKDYVRTFLASKGTEASTGKISTTEYSILVSEIKKYVESIKEIERTKIETSFDAKKKIASETVKNGLKHLKEEKTYGESFNEYIATKNYHRYEENKKYHVDEQVVIYKTDRVDGYADYAIKISDTDGIRKILSNIQTRTHSGNFVNINYETNNGINTSKLIKLDTWGRNVKIFTQ